MIVPLEEIKSYLRIDYDDEDELLTELASTAELYVADVLYTPVAELDENDGAIRMAILYTVAYLSEHREEANYTKLLTTIRDMLFGDREERF